MGRRIGEAKNGRGSGESPAPTLARTASAEGRRRGAAGATAKHAGTTPWEITDYLENDAAIAAYLEAVFEDGDPALITAAIGDIARARGMARLARDIGMSRPALYRALGGAGNPEFATMLKVLKALGLKLVPAPDDKAA